MARPRRHRALFVALAPLLLTLAACTPPGGPQVPTPEPTEIAFQTDNPGFHQGDVFGVAFVPFAEDGSPDAVMNVFQSGTVTSGGAVHGLLRPVDDIPRVNEMLGLFVFGLFTLPEGCPASTTNGVEAALAPVLDLAVWDGSSVDADGLPMFDGWLLLQESEVIDSGSLETVVDDIYVLVASRTVWSAQVPECATQTFDGTPFTFELDLDVGAGWQVLHVHDVYTFDTVSFDETFETRVRSLTIAEFEGLGSVGEVVTAAAGARAAVAGRPSGLLSVAPWALR